MSAAPLVSVIIPARNEAADIAACIECLAAQDHPLDRIEVVVVDGASTDGTGLAAEAALADRGFAHVAVLRNVDATTPSNLNVGLRYASGDIICRVDARTRVEPHYVRACAAVLCTRPDVSVVGGSQHAVPRDGSIRARGIARALNNRYSMGGSPYRRCQTSGPSDTVYLGAFRRFDLLAERGWDERLVTNQDFDLNRRLAARGLVWFDATLRSGYVPRASYRQLWAQYVRFGRAKVAYWRMTKDRPQPRQQLLLSLPAVGLLAAVLSAHRGRLVPTAAVAAVGLTAVDQAGSEEHRVGPLTQVAAIAAMLCVGVGWLRGAWGETLHR